ncbi:hypothetical protein HRG_004396 [Hirsutella rhossiliensis]|uniref:Uncharacterized protein n=1 Tax=Hirsutella rhossiliensis TaxID=111463 RepID=A0A9P8MX80_9HYPO|nr:uncharacterized protein HRG_04396 [Hirsutella rhossiliensis]KAH0963968.1 hypothetical protein HRG_04396 [Hirsutella rhossiliensis]
MPPRNRREPVARAGRGGNRNGNDAVNANDDADASADDNANQDGAPKLLKDGNTYIYRRVPFGFPPWYLENRAESATDLWDKLADRYRSMSARVRNMNIAVDQMRGIKRPAKHGDRGDRLFLDKKMQDAADALKEFSDLRRGSPVTLTEKPMHLLGYAEDSLWMALACLCRILEARMPKDLDGPDREWEERLKKLMENPAV